MKTVPISVRIPDEDAEFIAGLKINGAHTPSEKLRAIIAEARRRQQEPRDYVGCRAEVEHLLAPAMNKLRESELALQTHSEAMTMLNEWLPEMMAYIMANVPRDEAIKERAALAKLEQGVVDRIFRLFETVMRLGVTESCPCYDDHVLDRRMRPVLDLAGLIINRKGKQEE